MRRISGMLNSLAACTSRHSAPPWCHIQKRPTNPGGVGLVGQNRQSNNVSIDVRGWEGTGTVASGRGKRWPVRLNSSILGQIVA